MLLLIAYRVFSAYLNKKWHIFLQKIGRYSSSAILYHYTYAAE